jgi:hypothetical protein
MACLVFKYWDIVAMIQGGHNLGWVKREKGVYDRKPASFSKNS